jgi:hypothetical protein
MVYQQLDIDTLNRTEIYLAINSIPWTLLLFWMDVVQVERESDHS